MKLEQLRQRVAALHLNGVLAHWTEVATSDWLLKLVEWEEEETTRRSLERRIKDARLGRFKPLADFDWKWPKRCDRGAIEGLMSLKFIEERPTSCWSAPTGSGNPCSLKTWLIRR